MNRGLKRNITDKWKGSALREESTLHQISPYIGKMKSSMARVLVSEFSRNTETIYDPFCGAGTVALEAWIAGRNVIANDLSPYAAVLIQAKLFPSISEDKVINEINDLSKEVKQDISKIDLRSIPQWVRVFFHPETLREVLTWSRILKQRKSYFLLSCLLGILHHQRPGFLSYPSSHTVPYLRKRKFPQEEYPELYEYRPVRERLEKKVKRSLRRIPALNFGLNRQCSRLNAATFIPPRKVESIITSPPYMRQLDYGRDNRLRQWFLGVENWKLLDEEVSLCQDKFLNLMRSCLKLWHNVLLPKKPCVLVLGEIYVRSFGLLLPDVVIQIATKEVGRYSVMWKHSELIPDSRRVRRGYCGSLKETVLVLRNEKR